jgi:hypothetical protein
MRRFDDAEHISARIRGARVPLLAIYGSHDAYGRRADRYREVPGARVVKVAGTGHSPQVERPAVVAGLILGFARETLPRKRPMALRPKQMRTYVRPQFPARARDETRARPLDRRAG